MKRHRTIVSTLILLAGLSVSVPAAAFAGGPLLSGYGGPGAGAQTILGAALLNGPTGGGGSTGGGSAGGGGGAGGAPGRSSGPTATGAESGSATGSHPATVTRRQAARSGRRGGGSTTAAGSASGTHPRAAGANPNRSHLETSAAVTTSDAGMSWFSGADLLALVLASGALALVALATVRLTRTEHD